LKQGHRIMTDLQSVSSANHESPVNAGASNPLSGAVALVTGASSGLGVQFAKVLAGHGASVGLAARRTDRLEALAADLPTRSAAATMDVTSEASIIAGFDAIEAELGTPTIVIANAGMSRDGLAADISAEDFDAVMAVNVRGVFLTAREAARRMIAKNIQGRIVLIASIAGLRQLPGATAYSVSKAAVVMMAKSLAREWARYGINVNAICPGYIVTELNEDMLEGEYGARMIKAMPRRRVMDIDSLDGSLMWLVGPGGKFVTGSIVQVDDGQGL
jgi:NAD(P)-dependent dehydrogenase (short-subunit alcohol dehydrogenase family)